MLNKKKRIAELECENIKLREEIEAFKGKLKDDANYSKERIAELEKEKALNLNEIKTLKSRLRGDRYCSEICQHCTHIIKHSYNQPFGNAYTSYICELDNKCKNYEKAGDNNGKL